MGQTDSGKTHSIMHQWLGGQISFWQTDNESNAVPMYLSHCLFCSNGGMSVAEKDMLVLHILMDPSQWLFHMGCFPRKQDVFEFIAKTSDNNEQPLRKQHKHNEDVTVVVTQNDPEDIVFNENEQTTPNRVIVLDDLMTEVFGRHENEATVNLLTTKLSHHNNVSVLIVCHELYPKGKNSVLFRDQFTGIHLHAIANQQKICHYIYGFLTDDAEKRQFDYLFNKHVLRINDSLKRNR